jgi:hypothetical protein
MKKLLISILFSCAIFALCHPGGIYAQESKAGKVTVTITQNDKVVSDTTFELREGQDPEAVKKIISYVLDGKIRFFEKDPGHEEITWISSGDDEHAWYAEEFDFDYNPDSISKEESDVMVFKDESDSVHKVIVKKRAGGEQDVIIKSGKNIRILEEEDNGNNVIIIEEKNDKGSKEMEKHVKVIVESGDNVEMIGEDDLEWVEEDEDENIDVYVIKKDDETKVIKKVKVEVKEVDEDEETPAPEKEKKEE